jgi:hypothetical protein
MRLSGPSSSPRYRSATHALHSASEYCDSFIRLIKCPDKNVYVFFGDTYLKQIFGKYFVFDLVLDGLIKYELNQSDAFLHFYCDTFFVGTKLDQLFVIVGLVCDLLDHLKEHQLQLDCADPIQA